MGEVSALLAEYHAVAHAMAESSTDHEAQLERLHQLQGRLEACNAWSFEAQAERVIQRFSLDADARVGTLSGGQKKRLALAQALAISPELLLLDEPTNHLDIGAIEWLEEMLIGSGVAMVFITHDRRFLDRVATRIVELDRGRLLSCPGSFATYLARKEQMLHDEAITSAKFDKFLAQEEVWIRKGVEARRTRNEGRVLRLEQLRRDRAARRERQGKVELALDAGDKSGKLVAELDGVSKSFDQAGRELKVVRDFSCRLQRGDKIGLIGPNGAGKTTLLRLILGELAPDSGRVRLGTKIQVAYFDQFRSQLDEEAALVDVISPGSDYVEIGNEKKHVIGYLGDFLFAPQRARSPVKSLSGGERNRLLLARLFARPANVLVLDEPTNDLDIETLELLEQLLHEYKGTLFLVSHDRAFLDNVVTQTIAAEGDGYWREYAGGYQDWADYQVKRRAEEAQPAAKRTGQIAPPTAAKLKTDGSRKLSYKEARELAELPGQIAALEQEQKAIDLRLQDPALYQAEPQEAQRIAFRLTEIDAELMRLLERWEALEG
jgi:ATP-binding cassette subfamily F protein uup